MADNYYKPVQSTTFQQNMHQWLWVLKNIRTTRYRDTTGNFTVSVGVDLTNETYRAVCGKHLDCLLLTRCCAVMTHS